MRALHRRHTAGSLVFEASNRNQHSQFVPLPLPAGYPLSFIAKSVRFHCSSRTPRQNSSTQHTLACERYIGYCWGGFVVFVVYSFVGNVYRRRNDSGRRGTAVYAYLCLDERPVAWSSDPRMVPYPLADCSQPWQCPGNAFGDCLELFNTHRLTI